MGDFHYHRFTPGAEDPGDGGERAALELQRGLELQPDNAVALRLQDQLVGIPRHDANGARVFVGGGANALGFSPELDILPDFQTYIEAFARFAPLNVAFLFNGIQSLGAAATQAALSAMITQQKQFVDLARDRFEKDASLGATEKDIAVKEAEFIQQQLDQAVADIAAAKPKLAETSFSFGDIIGTVGQIASAVVGVIAAIRRSERAWWRPFPRW